MIRITDLTSGGTRYRIADLRRLDLSRLPWVHRILIENLVRHGEDFAPLASWIETGGSDAEIAFWPGRVMMHDTTCGPALVDLAAARSALAEAGGDPRTVNPVLPVDVSTDHSLAVDVYGSRDAFARNMAREMERNAERYRFMKWAATALDNFTVHPPGTGIMHTINLERLATVVTGRVEDGVLWAVPDTLIGTDSHTPMVNGIGVLGWGVGGLEAESVMLGQPVMMRVPKVVGVRLAGRLRDGIMATDLALVVTHRLRKLDLAGRFVEFFGPGVAHLSAGDRSVVANMAPEYGSSTGYFPIDDATLAYLRSTGRGEEAVALVEDYARATGLWFDPDAAPIYEEIVEIDLSEVATSLAGPHRPQDLASPAEVAVLMGGEAAPGSPLPRRPIAIAAITSCTNTSDPRLLVAAGLVARKARALGLAPPPWVKTSLAPGSPTAERMLARAGLLEDLEAVGFAITGYGCTVCIGNSGPLPDMVVAALDRGEVRPCAILSGNRNFPGRVHPLIDDAFLASPPMVVAFALAGDAKHDITDAAIGTASDGRAIRLADLWPSGSEIDAVLADAVSAKDFAPAYEAAEASPAWAKLEAPDGALYPWDERSTYLRRPPFVTTKAESRLGLYAAAPILVLPDDITTDHISPAGAIPAGSDAGRWLAARGEDPADLNVFASRRGNWEVMLRGLFTNRSVANLLAPGIRPGETIFAATGEQLPLWRAAARYADEGMPVVIVAGHRYGTGSSRDWAAKGAALLGARAVLAAGFERIHRSNLVNMGILPLRLPADRHPHALDLGPRDRIEIDARTIFPHAKVPVLIHHADGRTARFEAVAEIETERETEILERGGLIPLVLSERLTRLQA
jgi:aconitate hydratase